MKSLVYICLASLFVSLVAFGQTTPPPGTTSLTADLSPLNLVPPLEDRTESGRAEVEITLIQASTGSSAVVNFEITLENASADAFTGFAIHEGVTGLNGPEVVQTTLTSDGQTPPGNTISGQLTVSNQTQLESLQAAVQNPAGFYVILTATDNPAGLLRGQLGAGDMGEGIDSLSDKLDNVQEQLDVIQRMVRSIGRVLGIDPAFLPEPEGETPPNGTGGASSNPANP